MLRALPSCSCGTSHPAQVGLSSPYPAEGSPVTSSFSYRVTAGSTSTPFGRHTDGAEVRSLHKEPILEELKWNSTKILLVFTETSWNHSKMVPKRQIIYCEKCTPNSTIGLKLFKCRLGNVCVHRSVCELSAHCVLTHIMHYFMSAGYYYTGKYCTYQDSSG